MGQVNADDAFEKPKAYLNDTNTTERALIKYILM